MKSILLFAFSLFNFSVFSQFTISGIVSAEDSGEPLAYSSISSLQEGTGVLADDNGHFVLSLEKKDSVIFSFIGYSELKLSAKEANSMNQFKLKGADFKIDEVVVTPPNPNEIMRKADSLAVQNHFRENTVQSGFYKEFLYKDQEIFKVTEASFGRYMYEKKGEKTSNVHVRKARAITDSIGLRELNQLFNRKKDTILITSNAFIGFGQTVSYKSDDKRDGGVKLQTEYEYNGITQYQGHEAYDISYKAYKGKREMADGRFLIHRDTYAFLAFEMYLNKDANLDKLIPFAVRAILTVLGYNFDINNLEYKVYAKPFEDQWFLDKSIVLMNLSVAKGGNWVNGEVRSEYYMGNPKPSGSLPDFRNYDLQDSPVEDFDKSFWESYYHLDTSERTEELAAVIGEKNKNFSGSILSDRHKRWLEKQEKKKRKKERKEKN